MNDDDDDDDDDDEWCNEEIHELKRKAQKDRKTWKVTNLWSIGWMEMTHEIQKLLNKKIITIELLLLLCEDYLLIDAELKIYLNIRLGGSPTSQSENRTVRKVGKRTIGERKRSRETETK